MNATRATGRARSLNNVRAAALAWGGALALLWWVAAGRSPASWWIGVPTVCAAAAVAVAMGGRAPRLRWAALPAFLVFVLGRSVAGSVDVALRALRPGLPIAPALFNHTLTTERGAVLLATLVSLLPGTLAARLEDRRLVVHSLGPEDEARREIVTLEGRIAGLLDVEQGASDDE